MARIEGREKTTSPIAPLIKKFIPLDKAHPVYYTCTKFTLRLPGRNVKSESSDLKISQKSNLDIGCFRHIREWRVRKHTQMEQNKHFADILPKSKPPALLGIPAKVAAIMAVSGGMLVGVTCGWRAIPIAVVIWGIIGGCVGCFVKNTLHLWNGFVPTILKAAMGGIYVGFLLCIITVGIMDGWGRLCPTNNVATRETVCIISLFCIPIGAVAGVATGLILWLDSGKQDC